MRIIRIKLRSSWNAFNYYPMSKISSPATAPDCTALDDGNALLLPLSGVTSETLLGVRGELKIQHNGEQYSLRRTRQGKLILTK